MSGFIGTRARRRRRQTILYFFLFIFFILFVVYLPSFDFRSTQNPKPDDNILPNLPNETNIETTTLEDLQLMIFQKEQKIKFRDGRISSLKSELKELENKYENMKLQYENAENKYNDYIKEKKLKKTIEVDPKKINNMESEINNLKNSNKKNNLLIKKLEKDLNKQIGLNKINTEDNEALRVEYQKIISKNIKLDNLIQDLETVIESQINEINKLKDVSHHNQ